jgi:hypothetical protein
LYRYKDGNAKGDTHEWKEETQTMLLQVGPADKP